ncbi:MP2K5 kinase, partial [Polypterus senegalus]
MRLNTGNCFWDPFDPKDKEPRLSAINPYATHKDGGLNFFERSQHSFASGCLKPVLLGEAGRARCAVPEWRGAALLGPCQRVGMLLLFCNSVGDMDNQVLVIRIKVPDGVDVDWTVHPASPLHFRDVLDVISQVLPDATTTAFEYEDEDGDRITVRSDEEMKAMLSYYTNAVVEQQMNGQLTEPLQIFPREEDEMVRVVFDTNSAKLREKVLSARTKVNTRAGTTHNSSSIASDTLPNNSLKKSSAELKKILANGQMNEQDIRNRDILGHGNGGTVYKAHHVPSGKILAVKVIPLDITAELQKQIMSELEILYKCDSSYIIGFYGAFFVENRISICTEFMDDVKPSNMLVNTRGQVKLCDFGVSTQLVNSIAKTYVGTNAYMADPPVLPAGDFSESFVHLITQCFTLQSPLVMKCLFDVLEWYSSVLFKQCHFLPSHSYVGRLSFTLLFYAVEQQHVALLENTMSCFSSA